MHDGFRRRRGAGDRWVDSCHSESGVHGAYSRAVWPGRPCWFGLRCPRRRSTMCSTKDRHRLAGGSCLRFASAESSLASLVVSASSRCLWICSSCANSGRHPKACQTAWSPRAGCSPHAGLLRLASLASAEDLRWHGHSDGIPRFSATAAATSNALGTCRRCLPSVDSVLETLMSAVGKLPGWRHWTQRLTSWEEVRPTPFLQSGLAGSKVPRESVGANPEAAHFSENVDSSMPHGPERGVSCGPESNCGSFSRRTAGRSLATCHPPARLWL